MTHKERLLATLKGEAVDHLPFLPRLDLWYRANRHNGTLPTKYKGATLPQILEGMDLGFHAVIPDYKDLRSPKDEVDRGLGLWNQWFQPYQVRLRNVERTVRYDGDYTTVEYRTPKGNLRTRVLYDEPMKRAGVTITHIDEHVIKSEKDLEPLGYIFENIEVVPNHEGYQMFQEQVGDNGLAVACTLLAASPMHLVMRDHIGLEDFFFMQYDFPDEMKKLESQLQMFYDKIFDITANSSAEVIVSGANYDSAVTTPPFFKEYITPALRAQSDVLHQKGKFLLTHTDGENAGLLQEYLDAKIDIADSVCPAPMTKLGIKDYRDVFDGKITVWGGVPSITLLEGSMSDVEFRKYMDRFFEDIGLGDHLIVSVADTMPPAAKFERIEIIAKMVCEFGSIGG